MTTGKSANCGPGTQERQRACENGTGSEICTWNDTHATISCKEAGTEWPDCPKTLGRWTNVGGCVPETLNATCGPGIQTQERTCENGTGVEICTIMDMEQKIPCKEAGTEFPDCPKIIVCPMNETIDIIGQMIHRLCFKD